MKVCNILIDGNNLFHSEFSIFTLYNKSPRFVKESDEVSFIQGVANKMFYAMSNLPSGGKVIFCVDSKSWRKSVEIPGGEYKARREDADGGKGQMDKETKDKFYALMEEYSNTLNNVGIVKSRVPGAEGDDLIFKWVEYFKAKGENVIIVAGDRDLTQTVYLNQEADEDGNPVSEPWVIQWNNNTKNNKIYVPHGWNSWLNRPTSIFDMGMGDDRLTLKKHVSDFGIELVPVNPPDVIVSKIFMGDDGDDVPSVWSFQGKTKDGKPKTIRVTDTIVTKVMEAVRSKYGNLGNAEVLEKIKSDDKEFLTDMSGMILRVMKAVDGTAERQAVVESIKRNRKLVHLHEDVIPLNLQSAIEDHIETVMDDLRTQRHKWNRKGLFEGTRFSDVAPPRRDDPFAFMKVPD